MRRIIMASTLTLAILTAAVPAVAATIPAHDIPSSRDSRYVSRFSGSVIVGYQRIPFGQLTLPLGNYNDAGNGFSRAQTVDGRLTRIVYVAPAGKSALEVWLNYRQALAAAGFKTRFYCSNGEGEQRPGPHHCSWHMSDAFSHEGMIQALSHGDNTTHLMINELGATKFYVATLRYIRPASPVDLVLYVAQHAQRPVAIMLEICAEKAMATGEVTASIGKSLAKYGHVALSGIHFATDSAKLTPDSDDELARMVALMKAQPTLKVYIVGHTDDTGTLAHNLELSQARADAVMKALAARGIAASRMAAKGLASYAPVASNLTAPGRAKNRRVELVEQ